MDSEHSKLVKKLSTQVTRYHKKHQPFYIYHGSTNSTRIQKFEAASTIDTSSLNRMLEVNPKAKTALVEPNVAMDELVRATLELGLIPPVVPEFPGITVGGAYQGGAGESSSFKWGGLHNITNWLEMILANGEVVEASPAKRADLLFGSAGSYGSLGIITAARINLIDATKYVNLTYQPVKSFTRSVEVIEQALKAGHDFVDGIMFSPNQGVVMTGRLSGQKVGRVRRYRRARDEWFYLRAEKLAKKNEATTETIPLVDYLFRYDRGGFWVGKYAFEHFKTPFNRTTRLLLNPLMKTRKMYQALQASGAAQEHIIQDLALPANRTKEFLEYVTKEFNIFPLWLCPLPRDTKSPLLASYLDVEAIINVGMWGPFSGTYQEFVQANRGLETKLEELGGRKWLYAHAYYTESEFWQVYDKSWYDRLRHKYHAETLPSVYEKVRIKKRYPVDYSDGVKKAIKNINPLEPK